MYQFYYGQFKALANQEILITTFFSTWYQAEIMQVLIKLILQIKVLKANMKCNCSTKIMLA